MNTNSLHSQGVNRLGKGMIPVGVARDGLVEIIEQDDPDRFFVEACRNINSTGKCSEGGV